MSTPFLEEQPKYTYNAYYGGRTIEIQTHSLYQAKLKAIEVFKVPTSRRGLLSVILAGKPDRTAIEIDTNSF